MNVIERVWDVPVGTTPKAGLVIIHGAMWHSGWFGELGNLLSSTQYSVRVSAPDLVSHGLSNDVVLGYRNYVPDFAHHAAEARAAIARARGALPEGTPIFLLGESMGGLCALYHLIVHENDVDGLILCGAVIAIDDALLPPRFVIPALRGLGGLLPMLGVPGQAIGGETFEGAFGDPEVGPLAREDPLVMDKEVPRLGFMTSVLDAQGIVKKMAAEKIKVRVEGNIQDSSFGAQNVVFSTRRLSLSRQPIIHTIAVL